MNGNFNQYIFLDGVEIKGKDVMKIGEMKDAKPSAGLRTFTRGYVGAMGSYRNGNRKGSYELDEVPEESDSEIKEKGEQFEIPTIVRKPVVWYRQEPGFL